MIALIWISQLNLACEQPLNHHTQEQLNREPEDQPLNHHTQEQLNREPEDVTSDKSSTSRTEFKEIRSRETLDSQREDSGSGERTSTDKDRHSSKLAQLRNRPKRKRREDHERKVTMRSVGVMASIPSFQGTSTESESCEEMSMAENSLSDVNSFSDNHLEEKQEDSFEREVDENGIIWDVDDDSHQSLLESRRFSPYGSEMKSPSIQGGALLDDSDSLDDIPVRDQSRRNGGYDSEELEGLGMSSSSFQTYPPVRKQVNFQTLSEYSDPTHYNVYRGSNNHKVNPKRREGYGILLNDTDDDYEEDIQRWRNFTADINTDLRQDQTGSHGNHQISSGLGKSSTFARLNTMALGRQNYWHREGHSLYSPHSVFAFGEPPLRTMSSPGLHRNFHSPISSWRPQRERFTGRNVGKSSSLSNLNLKASSITDLSLKTAVCKDSTTQTWLLDRRLTEKDLCYMGEISSSVSHSELARNSHSDSRTDSFIQKSDTRSFTSDSTLKSSRSFITDKNSLSGSVEEPREGHGHHSLSSGKSDRRSDIKHEEPLLYTSLINGSKGKSVSENSHSTQNASGSTRSESHKSVCSPKPESPRSGELESEKHGSQRKDNSEGDERQRAVTSSISGGKLELLARRNSSLSDHTQKNSTLSDHTQKNSTLSDHTQKNSMLSDHTQRNSTLSDHTQKNSTLSDHTRKNSTLSDHTQKNSTLSDDTQKNSQSVLAKQMGTRQSPGVVTEDKFSNQSLSSMNSKDMNRESSLKSIKTSNRDAEDSKQRPEISETREQKLLFSNDDESMKDDTSLDLSKSSHSEHDSESGHSLFPNPGTRNVVDNELSENKYNRSKSPSSGTKTNKSKENNDSQIKDGSSINTETFYDPGAISVSRKTRVSGDPGDEAEDASLMTDLSINSNLGDISNQSSNFSNFFNNSELEGQIPEKVKDPDKDKDCLEESAEMLPLAASVKQLHSGASEGESIETSDRGNSPGINTHHIVSPTADFRPFSLAFRETSELPVFSEAQETEDEEDLSTLDSCSVTLSSSGETKVLTSRREATRKRRQALHSIFRFLDINSLLVVAQVCREWKKVSRNRSLWKQVVLENRKCSSKFLISLSNWCTALKHLTLRNLSPRDQWQTEADDVYQSTIRGSLEPGLERLLQVTESTLQSISIISCGTLLTDKSVWLASSYSRMLCTVEYLSSFFPLGPDVMYALGAGCRDITTLKIQPIFPCENEEKFSNKCLQIVSQFCCDLETLSIGSSNIDINGLVLIAKGCQRLRQLELHHCQEVTSDISVAVCRLGLKHLLSLSFIHTPVTADALKHFYNTCKHLKYLHVALSVKDFQHGNTEKEQAKLKKWQKFVKDMKGLEKKPGLGNILKLNLQDT